MDRSNSTKAVSVCDLQTDSLRKRALEGHYSLSDWEKGKYVALFSRHHRRRLAVWQFRRIFFLHWPLNEECECVTDWLLERILFLAIHMPIQHNGLTHFSVHFPPLLFLFPIQPRLVNLQKSIQDILDEDEGIRQSHIQCLDSAFYLFITLQHQQQQQQPRIPIPPTPDMALVTPFRFVL